MANSEAKASLGDLLNGTLALSDHIRVPALAAQIAPALHTLDPDRRIAMAPDGEISH